MMNANINIFDELPPSVRLRLETDRKNLEKKRRAIEQNEAHIERIKNIKKLMQQFEDVTRTEGAFYLQFKSMPMIDVEYLQSVWDCNSDWKVFKEICNYFSVNIQPRVRQHRSDNSEL